MRLLTIFLAYFFVISCSAKPVTLKIFEKDEMNGQVHVVAYRFWKEKSCPFLLCGESSTTIINQGLRFELINIKNKTIKSNIITCYDGKNGCFDYRAKFVICEDKIIPLENRNLYFLDYSPVGRLKCSSEVVFEI